MNLSLRRAGWLLLACVGLLTLTYRAQAWGFYGHRLLNRLAVYGLPPEMLPFFKTHIEYLTANATRPDARRNLVPGEAPRHFLDVDAYGDSALTTHGRGLPRSYADAVAKAGGEDSLLRHGIVPWHIVRTQRQLTAAFAARDADQVLRLAADLGHYVADACVPLHTTRNYNGQLTGQTGIHGLWESRLPELNGEGYDLLTGPAEYLARPDQAAWAAVARAHAALDSVLRAEQAVRQELPEDRRYAYEQRGTKTVRVYSREFSQAYHRRLHGQVERQLRYAAHLIGSLWYTAWVDAGQPDFKDLPRQPSPAEVARLAAEDKQQAAAPEQVLPGHEE